MLNDRDSRTKYDAKNGELTFDTEAGPIFNYDGQHRTLAIASVLREMKRSANSRCPLS